MVWQDIAVATACWMFNFSLLWQIKRGWKTKKGEVAPQTSTLSAIGAYVMAGAFLTLGLNFSAATETINGVEWTVLFLQWLLYWRSW